jgi:AP-3 complex subunit delta
MFEKTLQDVVKGIRASKRDTALYISQCIAEIKTEINSSDMYVKANALQKLTFLQMMGYGTSWASFTTIEVMSSPRFAHKRIGYLAATQGFTQDTEVVLLATNLLKKELRGAIGGGMNGVYEAGLAINCISNIVTEDLAQDLLPEITNLTKHPQPYLRKKAILCLFKVFVKYPQGLRLTFARIQQCLSDTNPSVVSCAVNVITELSDKNPKNYLHLAPAFFDLLTTSSNNWMLIKVVKLLGSLVPEEPRLARKLLEPLAGIVRNTPAKSLLFEAVHAITLCLPYCRKSDGTMPAIVPDIVTLCAKTLRDFVEEKDQNLKYLGLVGFGSLMQSHQKVLAAADYRPLILACLSDEDVTIRSRALGLLTGMTSRKNLIELVSQLMQHVDLATGAYKLDLVSKIIEMCSGEKYALLQNFSWYLDILFKLGHMRGLDAHAELLRAQVTDIALRVLPVRPYAVRRSIEILLERENEISDSRDGITGNNGRGKHLMPQILPAVAWIVGEYSDLIPESVSMEGSGVYIYNERSEGPYHSIIQVLTAPSNISKLSAETQNIYLQAAVKVFAAATSNQKVADAELEACVKSVIPNLLVFVQSPSVEVQERAITSHAFMKSVGLEPHTVSTAILADSHGSTEGNLLGMLHSGSTSGQAVAAHSEASDLPAISRNISKVLNFSLKSSPMKPNSNKLQRKKHQSPQNVDIDINAPLLLSAFSPLLENEAILISSSSVSVESVSFTQQRPLKLQDQTKVESVSSNDFPPSQSTHSATMEHGDMGIKQNKSTIATNNIPVNPSSQTNSDPFYLNSTGNVPENEGCNLTNRFGAIELGDGESDGEANETKHRKKKKKKKKGTMHEAGFGVDVAFGARNLDMSSTGNNGVTIYNSEEEDEEGNSNKPSMQGHSSKKTKPGKEFSGLAKVDLTMPLRDDELMPERTHYVVPDRSDQALNGTNPIKPKKKKKDSSSKKQKKSSKGLKKSGADNVGDLLDLFDTPASSNIVPTQQASIMSTTQNPVNNAFDGIIPEAVASSVAPGSEYMQEMKPTKLSKRPWMRATMKTSQTSGPPNVDWSKVALFYRSSGSSKNGETSTSIVVRVDNQSSYQLTNLKLVLKGVTDMDLGTVAPGKSIESQKTSPILYKSTDESFDIKGSLTTQECGVATKVSLPAASFLSPQAGMTLENVARELQYPGWSSHSLKIDFQSVTTPEKVKGLLCKFLNAAEVEPGASVGGNGTFAARSAVSGSQIRVLVKVKSDSAKVDVKSMSPSLGKALVSDLKRLVL